MYYRKTYFCACEGQQEQMYLKHVAFLLKKFPERIVSFNTTIGSAEKLRKSYTDYDNAALFDYDFNDNLFHQNIRLCEQINRKSKKKGKHVYHAYSNVNIDLWFILHKANFNKPVSSNDAYLEEVRRSYGLDREADIKEKAVLEKILMQITLDGVRSAIRRADLIRANKVDTDSFLIDGVSCYPNPDFSLHHFMRLVLQDCGEF